ncbi:hypothetical protein BDV10DRAFT_188511 [Aspergillus recurvatus]
MASFQALPREVLHQIFALADQPSRKQLRLTNALLGEIGQTWIFQTIRISLARASYDRFQSILNHAHLARSVVKVWLDTVPDEVLPPIFYLRDIVNQGNGQMNHEYLEEDQKDRETGLPRRFWQLVHRLADLPRLRSVVLRSADDWVGEEEFGWRDRIIPPIIGRPWSVFQRSMAVLASLPRLPQELAIQDLAIQELQNINPEDPDAIANLNKVLGNIQSLRLNIANQLGPDADENAERDAGHEFYPILPALWLKPTTANIEHLTLYSSIYFGFYPKCDLPSVHFPRLKSLSLGNYTFVHDTQLTWITFHGSTLRELYLDNCPILHEVAVNITNDLYRIHRTPLPLDSYKTHPNLRGKLHAIYPTRWADYFRAFTTQLPHLRHFRFGRCQYWWGFRRCPSGSADGTSPFEREKSIEIGFHNSYLVFCDGLRDPFWNRMAWDADREDGHERDLIFGEVLRPSAEDRTALGQLLGRLGQRV